jgi:hypothetical protein
MAQSSARPHFPYVAAAICAVCVAAAAWTWMRYSYAWDVAADRVLELVKRDGVRDGPTSTRFLVGRYASLSGGTIDRSSPGITRESPFFEGWTYRIPRCNGCILIAVRTTPDASPHADARLTGRFVRYDGLVQHCFDFTASRFTWHSITGLAVGAVGVFVLGFYLRRWLRRLKAAADDGVG